MCDVCSSGDVFRASVAHWIREDYQDALGVLCQQTAPPVVGVALGAQAKAEAAVEFPAAVAWEVMKYISNRPVLKRAGLFLPLFLRFSIGKCRNCPFFRAL